MTISAPNTKTVVTPQPPVPRSSPTVRFGIRLVVHLWRWIWPFIPVVVVWQLAVIFHLMPPAFLPSPGVLPGAFQTLVANDNLLPNVLNTLWRVMLAGAVGLLAGLVFGALVATSERLADILQWLIQFLQSVGEIGWLPLLVLWSGFNLRTIVIAVSYTVFFPVFYGTVSGFRSVPRNLTNGVQTLGGRRWHLVTEVLFPGALPSIFSGFRTGMGFGWRTIILAEMLVGLDGLGSMMFQAREFFRVDWIMVEMIIVGVLWLLTDELLLRPLEERTIKRWGLVR